MPWIRTPHGTAHVKLAKSPRVRCKHPGCTAWGDILCDYNPLKKKHPCNKRLCRAHARHIEGKDLDYCLHHPETGEMDV